MKTPESPEHQGEVTSREIIPNAGEKDLHPDIKAGIDTIAHTKIAKAIRGGYSVAGLGNAARNFKDTLAAAEATLTAEGQQHYSGVAYEEVQASLHEGLARAVQNVSYYTGLGIAHTSAFREIENLFDLAGKLGIDISFVPEKEEGVPSGAILAPLRTKEEVLAYCQDLVNKNLVRGVEGKLRHLKFDLGRGNFSEAEFDKGIEEWLAFMQQNGYEVIDEEVSEEISADLTTKGILVRKINKADVRKLKEEVIKNNLVSGLEHLLETSAYNIKSGYRNPLDALKNAKDKYAQEGEKRGLVDRQSPTFISGGHFNPDRLPEEITKIVKKNFTKGLEAILKRFSLHIQNGDIKLIDWISQTVEEYFKMAEEAGVEVENKEEVREYLKSCVSAENLQAAVDSVLGKVKDYLRDGDIHLAKFLGTQIKDIRRFVHDKGFDGQVDFSAADKYLKEVNLGGRTLKD